MFATTKMAQNKTPILKILEEIFFQFKNVRCITLCCRSDRILIPIQTSRVSRRLYNIEQGMQYAYNNIKSSPQEKFLLASLRNRTSYIHAICVYSGSLYLNCNEQKYVELKGILALIFYLCFFSSQLPLGHWFTPCAMKFLKCPLKKNLNYDSLIRT